MVDFVYAETREEIARQLRGDKGVVVRAPRGVGKTVELLKFAEEKYPNGQFAVICMNAVVQKDIIKTHWKIFNRISQADIVAKRLLGEPLGGVDINPPLVLTPDNLHLLRMSGRPLFIDEYRAVRDSASKEIMDFLNDNYIHQKFIAGVTS
jgi:hypothetical protein